MTLRQLKTITRSMIDVDRARRDVPQVEPVPYKLCKVTSASAISGQDKRWLYTVKEATIGAASPYTPGLSVNAPSYSALSVSELTNGASAVTYAYGIVKANIPAGFAAVQIPLNTFVLCVPWWKDDGTGIYLIVNTQAIDGVC